MPDPIVDTLEVTVAPQIDVDPLTYIVLAAHQSHDLEFPVNGPWLRNQTENTRILTKRAAMEQAIRKDIAENAERTFGLQSNEAISLAIFRDIASPIDRIALAQRGQSDGGVHSWNSTDNSACVNLINTVGRVLDTPKYTRFLNTHEAFKKTLLLINSAFVKEENPDRLREYQREFLSLATDAFERGEPILLFNLDFTQGSNHQQQLEARAQLVFPLDAEQKNTMETIVHRAYEQQNALHPTMDIAKPAIVIGTGAGWAGTELISYTTGEQFDQNAGFLFLPNIIKEKDIFDCTIDLAELPTSALTELAIWRYYITHEIGHAYHLIEDPALHEAETDIPSIMSCLLESRTESASPGS